jgi:hypothetical protein
MVVFEYWKAKTEHLAHPQVSWSGRQIMAIFRRGVLDPSAPRGNMAMFPHRDTK